MKKRLLRVGPVFLSFFDGSRSMQVGDFVSQVGWIRLFTRVWQASRLQKCR